MPRLLAGTAVPLPLMFWGIFLCRRHAASNETKINSCFGRLSLQSVYPGPGRSTLRMQTQLTNRLTAVCWSTNGINRLTPWRVADDFAFYVSSCEQAILPRSFKVPRVGHTSIAIAVLAAAHLLGLPYMLGKLDRAHAFGAYRAMAVGENGQRAEKQKITFSEEGVTYFSHLTITHQSAH